MQFTTNNSPGEQSPGLAFNIIIPHRGPWEHLWFSVQSCEAALRNSSARYKYIIVLNGHGDEPLSRILQGFLAEFSGAGLLELVIVPEALSPPAARNMGAAHATGEFIFFFDNHCIPASDYFSRAIKQMTEKRLDMLHSTWVYGRHRSYHYRLTGVDLLFARPDQYTPKHPNEPYRCGVSGHGGFVVRRSVWEKLGGYWRGFKGYAGEEFYLDMKLWLSGYEVWIDPLLIHGHLPGERLYPRSNSPDCPLNHLMTANIIGGRELVRETYKQFRQVPLFARFDLLAIMHKAVERSEEHARELQSTFIRSYAEQLGWFEQNGVAH